MRNDDYDRRDGVGAGMIAVVGALAVGALIFMWAPWSTRTADNSAPGTTVGSTARLSTPPSPTAPAPAAPSTNR